MERCKTMLMHDEKPQIVPITDPDILTMAADIMENLGHDIDASDDAIRHDFEQRLRDVDATGGE